MAKVTATAVEEPVVSEAGEDVVDGNRERAASIVTKYAAAAAAAGLIPMPAADIAAISAVQIKMVHSLSKLYG
ncbi:MAG TPA: DUF697 domain-containing protein, partial [Candidatus Latescibacteria bacterium]|nr:DUF697 domain-containing protein [Candidatus Latescibacterota bacterium]